MLSTKSNRLLTSRTFRIALTMVLDSASSDCQIGLPTHGLTPQLPALEVNLISRVNKMAQAGYFFDQWLGSRVKPHDFQEAPTARIES